MRSWSNHNLNFKCFFPYVNVIQAFVKFELGLSFLIATKNLFQKVKGKIKGKMDLPNKPSCKYFCE